MVTIEQKLLLFEKLIQHDIFEKAKDEKCKKEQYYEKLALESKTEIDKACEQMKIEEKQKLDRLYIKEEAQIRKTYENSFLKTKEELLSKLLNKVEEKLSLFTKTDAYKEHIDITINTVCSELDFDQDINLFMTEADVQTYGSYILEHKRKNNINSPEISSIDNIIGGIIVKTVDESMRYDFSLKRSLEENMETILKSLNAIIEEGDTV